MKESEDMLSYNLIGRAMNTHSGLGPGLDERFYQRVLHRLLTRAKVPHESKPRRQLIHRGILADIFEPDIVAANSLIADLKVLQGDFHPTHFVQLTSYLKAWQIESGLLLDFGKESLIIKRFSFTDRPPPIPDPHTLLSGMPSAIPHRELAQILVESLLRILRGYGLRYRDTTYQGLLRADLLADGYHCLDNPVTDIHCDGECLGQSRLDCLVVQNQTAVLCLSLRDAIRAADRAILQTRLKHLGLRWGLIAHFGKQDFEIRWITRSN
jgi:GxxExxY protein